MAFAPRFWPGTELRWTEAEKLPASLVTATGNTVALLSVEVSVEGTLTGEGLAEVLKGTQVVVAVSNSPSFAEDAVMELFRSSTANLLKAEAEAGVNHHVALSVVSTERFQESGYFRAKQEIIRRSLVAKNDPRTVVTDPHATYFGTELEETTPLPGPSAQTAGTRFSDWLTQQA